MKFTKLIIVILLVIQLVLYPTMGFAEENGSEVQDVEVVESQDEIISVDDSVEEPVADETSIEDNSEASDNIEEGETPISEDEQLEVIEISNEEAIETESIENTLEANSSFETGSEFGNSITDVELNDYDQMVLLAQMQSAFNEFPANLRNNILHDDYKLSDLRKNEYETQDNSFSSTVEAHDGSVTEDELIGYIVIEHGLIEDNDGTLIGEGNTIIIDYNDDNGEANAPEPEWHLVSTNNSYENPIVIAQLSSHLGNNPTHIRIKDVTSSSFQLFMEEWESKRDTNHHYHELVSYIIIEEGIHELGDDVVDANLIADTTSYYEEFTTHNHRQRFEEAPVTLSQTQTFYDDNAVWMRQQNNTRDTVELYGQTDDESHLSEVIAVVSIGEPFTEAVGLSSMTVNKSSVVDGETVYVEVTVKNQLDEPYQNGTVNIFLDGSLINQSTEIGPGVYGLELLPIYDMTNLITATVEGGSVNDSYEIEVLKADSYIDFKHVEVDKLLVTQGERVIITAQTIDQYDVPILDSEVLVYSDDLLIGQATSTGSGYYQFDFVPTAGAENIISLTFDGQMYETKFDIDVQVLASSFNESEEEEIQLSLNSQLVELEIGDGANEEEKSFKLNADIDGGSLSDISWSTSDSEIATVDQSGLVTSVNEGNAIITARHNPSGEEVSVEVVVFLVEEEEVPLGSIEFYDPYVVGYPNGSFGPSRYVTRAELATMVAKILNMNVNHYGEQYYSDATIDHWAYPYVQAMSRKGIWNIERGGVFLPDEKVTFNEIVTLMFECVNEESIVVGYDEKVEILLSKQILNAFDVTRNVDSHIERKDVVVMLNRMILRPEVAVDSSMYNDISQTMQEYGHIMSATQAVIKQE